MTDVAVLRVANRSERGEFEYRLERPIDRSCGAASPTWHVKVDIDTLEILIAELYQIVDDITARPEEYGAGVSPLTMIGQTLFEALFPPNQPDVQSITRALQDMDTPLLVVTDDPSIPWELLYDGKEFWGLRLEMGRSLEMANLTGAKPLAGEVQRCLIVADPTEELEEAAAEASTLKVWLEERGVHCEFLCGAAATKPALVRALLAPFDIIHYTGHVNKDTYSLELADGAMTPHGLSTMIKGAPIVFLNGCRSARAVKGLTDALLLRGVRAIIGSVFETLDPGAAAFGMKFYECALQGETLGTAMRQARAGVKSTPAHGATWACFVMYGHPALTLGLKPDELETALKSIGFEKVEFDQDCVAVLQQALDFGRRSGQIGSSHLLTAMIGGSDRSLAEVINRCGVRPDAIRDAFCEVFNKAEDSPEGAARAGKVVFSSSVTALLKVVRNAAQSRKATQRDLVFGLATTGGGTAGKILRGLGVSLESVLGNTRVRPPGEKKPVFPKSGTPEFLRGCPGVEIQRIGPLSREDCASVAWDVLLAAAGAAAERGSPKLSTAELLAGLMNDSNGLMASRLRYFGLRLKLPRPRGAVRPTQLSGPVVSCSSNAENILLQAHTTALASQRSVEESDLLQSFVICGGGGGGQALEKAGFPLELLVSELWAEDRSLVLSRFDPSGIEVLDCAAAFAARKGHAVVGRAHLLYALLLYPSGLMRSCIHSQGVDPDRAADLMQAETAGGRPAIAGMEWNLKSISSGLLNVLFDAERGASGNPVAEKQLASAWLRDGGGTAGSFLVHQGVRLRELISCLEEQ